VVQLAAPATRTSFDWKQNAGACVERVLEKIERAGFPGLRKHIVVRHVITPADIRARFNCYLGSIHGFASHSLMTAFRRMRMDPPEVPGFYFVGASTHPGGLVPLVLSSAKNAARKIIGGEEPR
jgi:phytoene desaturase